MRIMIVTNLFPPAVLGGYEIECQQVADALAKRGHEIHVLTSKVQDNSIPLIEKPHYPITRTLSLTHPFEQVSDSALRLKKWLTGKENEQQTKKLFTEWKPDVMFYWSPLRIGISPAKIAHKHNIPILWRIGDENLSGFVYPKLTFSIRNIYRWVADRLFTYNTLYGLPFKYISCISRTTKHNLILAGVPLERAEIHYKGIPIEQFPIKQPGNLSNPVKILYVGRLHPVKGVETLIQAISKAQHEKLFSLTLVGTGNPEYVSYLKKMAKNLKVEATFTGFISYENLSAIYQTHDIFVFPSLWQEPQGTTYLEAMCSGIPVISTEDGGQGELLTDNETALFFPKSNVEALCEQIIRLCNDEILYQTLVKNARQYVENHLSFDTYVDKLEKQLILAKQE